MGSKANVLVGDAAVVVTTISGHPVGPVTIGYTVDGVDMSIKTSFANIKVEEVNGTIIRKITDQEVDVTIKIAEGTLDNLAMAIPGSSLAGAVLTIGGDALSEFSMTITGLDPAGAARTIALHHVNATGEVGIPFKKGEISVVPVTFSCLVHDAGDFGTITDA
ncbi:MAG: hypothetical protein KJ954_14190 [Alphaproteobacteria bacterium]|nr:hypothetical protein [Alphaproteobacteria bacterium]